jgi:sugar/nucleoside kinase (ribokinase family)
MYPVPSPLSRQQICQSTARQLHDAAPRLSSVRAVIGLDGFVDEIIAVVDTRHDHEHYEPVKTIADLGRKISNAAGESSNYEMVVKRMKLGGNGPLMADALASAGLAVTYIGSLGYPNIHPVFHDFATRAKVLSIAEPGHTDALEFEDGKLMLGKLTPLNDANWDNLISRVGRDKLTALLTDAQLIAMNNWTMLPHLSGVWAGLLKEVMPHLPRRPDRMFFIDMADPEKRAHEDIAAALKLLTGLQQYANVVLGLNLKESMEIAHALGLPAPADPTAAIQQTAQTIRRTLGLSCVLIHPRRGAAAATAHDTAQFAGPFVQRPKISTGAGDHFNAGFCLARVLGLSLEESLCAGVASSGYYVRNGHSPTIHELAGFVAELPEPEP